MQEKILPLAPSPIKVYPDHAFILSMLLTNEKGWAWFYSNYIQIYFAKNALQTGKFFVNFYVGNATKQIFNIPFLSVRTLDKFFFIEKLGNITRYLIDNLNAGYYVQTILDEYYIPDKVAYCANHYLHQTLIFGYNLEQKVFYISGFNEEMIFTPTKVSFNELEQAFLSVGREDSHIRDHFVMSVRVVDAKDYQNPRPNFNYFEYPFDLAQVREALTDYVYSRNSFERLRMFYPPMPAEEYGLGMEVYPYLKEFLQYLITHKINVKRLDIRPVYGLYDHKQCMLMRLNYIRENHYILDCGAIIDRYREVEKQAALLYKKVLMYNNSVTQDEGLIEDMIGLLDGMERMEFATLTDVLQKIKGPVNA